MQRIVLVLQILTIFTVTNLIGWVLIHSEVRPALEVVIMPYLFTFTIGMIVICTIIALSSALKKPDPINTLILPNILYLAVAAILALIVIKLLTDSVAQGAWLLLWLILSVGATTLCFFIVRATLRNPNGWLLNPDIFQQEVEISKATLFSFAAMNSLFLLVLWNQTFLLLAQTLIFLLLFLAWSFRKNTVRQQT